MKYAALQGLKARTTGLLVKSLAALSLTGAAAPALADYFIFQGQLEFQSAPGTACAAMSTGSFHVVIVGRNQAGPGGGIDAYLYGEQLLHGHIRGATPSLLSLAFIGESGARHTMRLRGAGPGAYVGELQAQSLLAALYSCDFVNARIRLNQVAGGDQSSFERASVQFQLDSNALQAAMLGLQGKVKESIPAVERAMAAKQQVLGPEHPQLLPYYFFLAQLHFAEGSIPAAIPLQRSAVRVCEKNYGPQSACTGAMLANLGTTLADSGEYSEAESTLRLALGICDKIFGPNSAVRGIALNGLSGVLIYTGRYAEAESTLSEALQLNKKWPNPDNANVGISLNNFGVLYRLTGQYGKAETAMRRAVAIDEKAVGADNPLTILNTVVLAQVLHVVGKDAAAEPIARRALAAAERILGSERQDHPALATAQICLAEILRQSGRFAEAEPLYRKALANGIKYLGPDHPNVAAVGLVLAKLLHDTGHDQEALELLHHADVVAHVSGSQTVAWQVAGELMQIYAAGKSANPVRAIFYGKEAVNDLQKLRGDLAASNREVQQAFVSSAEVSAVYRTLASLLINDGRNSEAQQVLTMVKEQEFYEFTQRTAASDEPKTVATLNSNEKKLAELDTQYVGLGKEYGTLKEKFQKQGDKLSAADRTRLDALRKAMDSAQANFEASAAAIAKNANDPEARKRRQTEINDYSRAFQGTLKEMGHDAVVAQYIVLDDQSCDSVGDAQCRGGARDQNQARGSVCPDPRFIEKPLINPGQDPLPQAQGLYQLLIAPIADDLRQAGAKTVMLDLDDMLRYLPFAALHDGKNYLVENLSIVMVTEAVRDKLGKAPQSRIGPFGVSGTAKAGPGPTRRCPMPMSSSTASPGRRVFSPARCCWIRRFHGKIIARRTRSGLSDHSRRQPLSIHSRQHGRLFFAAGRRQSFEPGANQNQAGLQQRRAVDAVGLRDRDGRRQYLAPWRRGRRARRDRPASGRESRARHLVAGGRCQHSRAHASALPSTQSGSFGQGRCAQAGAIGIVARDRRCGRCRQHRARFGARQHRSRVRQFQDQSGGALRASVFLGTLHSHGQLAVKIRPAPRTMQVLHAIAP